VTVLMDAAAALRVSTWSMVITGGNHSLERNVGAKPAPVRSKIRREHADVGTPADIGRVPDVVPGRLDHHQVGRHTVVRPPLGPMSARNYQKLAVHIPSWSCVQNFAQSL
jgi:hypothetical protein